MFKWMRILKQTRFSEILTYFQSLNMRKKDWSPAIEPTRFTYASADQNSIDELLGQELYSPLNSNILYADIVSRNLTRMLIDYDITYVLNAPGIESTEYQKTNNSVTIQIQHAGDAQDPFSSQDSLSLKFVEDETSAHGETGIEMTKRGTLYPGFYGESYPIYEEGEDERHGAIGDSSYHSLGPIDGALIPDTFDELIDLIISRLRGDNQKYRMDIYLFKV